MAFKRPKLKVKYEEKKYQNSLTWTNAGKYCVSSKFSASSDLSKSVVEIPGSLQIHFPRPFPIFKKMTQSSNFRWVNPNFLERLRESDYKPSANQNKSVTTIGFF